MKPLKNEQGIHESQEMIIIPNETFGQIGFIGRTYLFFNHANLGVFCTEQTKSIQNLYNCLL